MRIEEITNSPDVSFKFRMLGRMECDCEYYLGYGNRNPRHLWAGNEAEHIADMRAIWNSFPEDNKPEWLTMAQINQYALLMGVQ